MRNIAIVEDELANVELMKEYFAKYEIRNHEKFKITSFNNADSFLENYHGNYDIVLMDIELPGLNGIGASKKLREIDQTVTLIFVTKMAQFAVKGYDVQAFNFIVKPVEYANFELNIRRAIKNIDSRREIEVLVTLPTGVIRIKSSNLMYVEVQKHHLIYHCEDKVIESSGTLKNIEEILAPAHFVRCNNCYLVNLNFVTEIRSYDVVVGDTALSISRPKRKSFLKDLNEYLGGGI